MNWAELFLIAVGLSMDAFAVALCKGLSMPKATVGKASIVGLYFGAFQAGMPLLGYFLGARFADSITSFDHWIAFVLLLFIGGKMFLGSFKKEGCEDRACPAVPCTDRKCPVAEKASITPTAMLPLALATSIDALAVGVSFAFLKVSIVPAVSFIGIVTLALSAVGVLAGKGLGLRFKSKAELAGGLILILMGCKILWEHLVVK